MHIEYKFFQSNVARRIFLLFILSAFIPVIFLVGFQLVQMKRQLNESSQIQVRQDVKNIGMVLIGRLFHVESQLNLLGAAIDYSPEGETIKSDDNLSQLMSDFTAIMIVKKNGTKVPIMGNVFEVPNGLSSSFKGKSWVTTEVAGSPVKKTQVLLMHRLKNKDDLIVGMVGHIWDFDMGSGALFWVLDHNNHLLYSNTTKQLPAELLSQHIHQDSAAFAYNSGAESYFVGYWNLFLQERLNSSSWVVALALPSASIFVGAKQLYAIILPTIAFALLLTMLLSQAQIRRSLIPLEQLRKATRRIAGRDFSGQVAVNSGDEFEELGLAFNSMSKSIHQQLQTLSIMSHLDQTILTSQDGEEVLGIIFARLNELVDYDCLVVGLVQQDEAHVVKLLIDDLSVNGEEAIQTYIFDKDIDVLRQNKEIYIDLARDTLPEYMKVLVPRAIKYAIIFPILHRLEPRALICLGFRTLKTREACQIDELRDVFYRATVAYTHAEWEKRLYRQAHFDDLTDLPNRLVLRTELQEAMGRAKSKHQHCVLLFIDLDNFKDINDTMGHSFGDLLLAKIAQRMLEKIGHMGILARIGGDEFTLLITDISSLSLAKQKAVDAAERFFSAFEAPIKLKEIEYQATASMGIVIYPDDCSTSDDMLKFADMSMYKAKQSGKNCYVFFSNELGIMVQERNQLLQEIHQAIQENQFLIYFQPKIDSRDNELVGAEVLLRWQHPERGLLLPDEFLPLVEETNLIYPLGKWVIQTACQQIKLWRDQGLKFPPLAVNIAAQQFTEEDLGDWIKSTIEQVGIDPRCMDFEVTESAMIGNFKETDRILQQINDLGCRLAIDDFGTGYSSLHYLHMLPLNIMKIDRVFVQGLPQDEINCSIIKAIVALAKNLNMDIVAEGIETKEQSKILCELGCYVQQGFYYSQPLPAREFVERFLM